MVRTFLKVYMKLGSYFLFLQEQIKDIIIDGVRRLKNCSCATSADTEPPCKCMKL
jgi:hypothetical protein